MDNKLARKKTKNPLPKRLKRELKADIGKYIVIFALLFIAAGFTSGFLVAAGSMIVAYDESFEKYNIEDGHFSIQNKINPAQTKEIEEKGITIYDISYSDVELSNESTMRIFKDRDQVNIPCVMDGKLPTSADEIAIDRMYAANNNISIGDKLTSEDGEKTWTITGLVALPDYSALFEDNDDLMFDSLLFGVGIVNEEGYEELSNLVYTYAWKYNYVDGAQWVIDNEKDIAEDLMQDINSAVSLKDYVPRYINQGINFTGEDMGGDKASMEVFLYIIVVITAFVYAITMKDTISRESAVIGTLLASGYTKSELVRHYLSLPLIVTLVAALVANVAGYTVFKDICVDLYYNSYSLPTYTTVWSLEAFLKTTLIPAIIMGLVSWIVLRRNLSFSPMNFLRRNLTRQKNKSAIKLNKRIPFFARFRTRIMIQNLPNYAILFVGILFANILLFFGMGLPDLLNNYQDSIGEGLLAKYQYVLSVPDTALDEDKKTESLINMMQFMRDVETDNPDAEKFSVYSLNTIPENGKHVDDIMLYGVTKDSKYIDADFGPNDVYVSSLMADKYRFEAGDEITLTEKYEDKDYTFKITGVLQYDGAMTLFMDMDKLNETFDFPKGLFMGYFSDSEITDISPDYVGTVIDFDSLTKVSRQLMKSFGGMMYMMDAFAIILFVFLIYLLSKIIIEKNAQSISMTKILGYSDGEVSRLYLVATSIAVVIFAIISYPICDKLIDALWRYYIALEMSGWIKYQVDSSIFVKMFALGMASYIIVVIMEFFKIKRIPMDEALKNVE